MDVKNIENLKKKMYFVNDFQTKKFFFKKITF